MLEFIIISLIASVLVVCFGYVVGSKHPADPVALEKQEMFRRMTSAESDADYWKRVAESRADDNRRLTSQRDDYRKIAETHDVRMPDLTQHATFQSVWKKRCYADTINDNLVALAADLAPFAKDEVEMHIKLLPKGRWQETWEKDNLVVTRSGPPERVMKELKALLLDPSIGLVSRFSYSHSSPGTWKEPSSPMGFEVALDVRQLQPKRPEVQVVEVLRVQEDVREVVHERVVYHDPEPVAVPEGKDELEARSEDLTENPEVKALIEIAVEEALHRKLGSRGRLAHTSREGHVGDARDEEERERQRAQVAAQKQAQ